MLVLDGKDKQAHVAASGPAGVVSDQRIDDGLPDPIVGDVGRADRDVHDRSLLILTPPDANAPRAATTPCREHHHEPYHQSG